ncbi:UNVERIFIED_CONTAM: hypothetical protein Scaly_1595800 [Sesamum calycinum]|uniref:HTH CENPB-type domain-containing protein n=1 Tax=Sesamum calycinum TaxID=2727403 RepID=A0AAW2PBF6_9LAMI
MEKVLYEWFLQYQDRVNMTGELILKKAKDIMKLLYSQHPPEHQFSQGWLEKFKIRHGIKSFRRFGESGSVDMQNMEMKLEAIREKINQFSMKDVFNLDETGLFYSPRLDNQYFSSINSKLFSALQNPFIEEISSDSNETNFEESLHELENIIKDVGYRNEMDVNKIGGLSG